MVAVALMVLIVLLMLWIVVVRVLARRAVDRQRQADPGTPRGRAGPVAALVVLMFALLASGTALGAAIDISHRQTGAAVGPPSPQSASCWSRGPPPAS